MVTTDAVSTRCPALARHAQTALSLAVILGEPINPTVFFEDEQGEVRSCEALEPVSIPEISRQAQTLAGVFETGATISYFPALIECDDTGVEAIVVVTHDLLIEEVTVKSVS